LTFSLSNIGMSRLWIQKEERPDVGRHLPATFRSASSDDSRNHDLRNCRRAGWITLSSPSP
jgi:hypothetical protein